MPLEFTKSIYNILDKINKFLRLQNFIVSNSQYSTKIKQRREMQPCLSCVADYLKSKSDSKTVNNNQNIQVQEEQNNPTSTDQNDIIERISKGDLYVIGRIWIGALQSALLGVKVDVMPVVHAAKQPEAPQRPPKMKYTDLPIYQSPHHDYKEYLEDKYRCPERNTKLLQKYLLPYTKKYRRIAREKLCCARCIVEKHCVDACAAVKKAKNDFKATMRDPNNLTVRQGVIGAGALTGYLIGGRGGLPRRVFFTSVGVLTTGALCFPEETDEYFRTFVYTVGKAVLAAYNVACGKDAGLREKIACREDLPPQPPQRKAIQCPPKT